MTYRELTIDDVMADPMIRKVMAADRQEPRDVALLLRGAAQRIKAGRATLGFGRRLPIGAFPRECCAYC